MVDAAWDHRDPPSAWAGSPVVTPPPRTAPRPLLIGAVAGGLTVLAALVGSLGRPAPQRTLSGWQVTDVPAGLLGVVGGTALGCLVVAAGLARPWSWSAPPAAVWWTLAGLSAFAGTWNALYFAALGGGGPVIPVFGWLFTSVPAFLAALAVRRRGRTTQLRAGLSTAVVSLPLLALAWALYAAPEGFARGLGGGLYSSLVFGVVPLALALVLGARSPAE
jgi:hypothetical protein